jgi:hypothetical protein
MRFRQALVLCGAVIVAAVPLWADSIPYPCLVNESTTAESFMSRTSSYNLDANSRLTAGFLPASASASVLIDSLDANHATDAWDSRSSLSASIVLPASSDDYPAGLSDIGSFGIASSDLHLNDVFSREGRGERHKIYNPVLRPDGDPRQHAEQVPEPGSLPLVLIGLTAVALLSLRRALSLKNVQVRG